MNKHYQIGKNSLVIFIFSILFGICSTGFAAGNNGVGSAQLNYSGSIIERLDRIETMLNIPQVMATFCFDQGMALEIGADWKMLIDAKFKAGIGWAEVFSGEGTAEARIPAGPIPSETAVGASAGLGRGMQICVDLPIEMGPTDTALLAELANDINEGKANDFPNRGKFQRRAHRLLNFTKRRVPGIQTRLESQYFNGIPVIQAATTSGADDEFDIVDAAVDNLLNGGLRSSGRNFGILKNQDIKNLVGSFDAIPADITAIINDPNQLLNPLSDTVSSGLDNVTCETFGLNEFRNEKPGLNNLCSRLEGLPNYDLVEQVISGDLIADLYEALDNLTIGSSAAKVSSETRNKFCSSKIGRLFKYNVFCGRN